MPSRKITPRRLYAVRNLSVKERLVLHLLRGGASSSAEVTEGFHQLRLCSKASAMHILAQDSPYIGRQEIRLIAWLALFQRTRPYPTIIMDMEWRNALTACARQLEQMDIRLDHRMIVRDHADMDAAGPDGQSSLPPPATDAPQPAESPLLLEERALALVRQKDLVTRRELLHLGLNARMISLLCRRGLLRQLGLGVYGPTARGS